MVGTYLALGPNSFSAFGIVLNSGLPPSREQAIAVLLESFSASGLPSAILTYWPSLLVLGACRLLPSAKHERSGDLVVLAWSLQLTLLQLRTFEWFFGGVHGWFVEPAKALVALGVIATIALAARILGRPIVFSPTALLAGGAVMLDTLFSAIFIVGMPD